MSGPNTRSVERKCQRERAASTINTPLQQNKHGCLDRALLTFDLIPGEQTQRHHMMKTQAVRGGRRWFVGKRKVVQPGHPTLNVIPVSMATKRSPSSNCCCKDRCLASQNKSSAVNHELPLEHMLISAGQPFSGFLLTEPGLSLFPHPLQQVARLCSSQHLCQLRAAGTARRGGVETRRRQTAVPRSGHRGPAGGGAGMSGGVSLSRPGHPGSGKHTQNVSKVELMQKNAEQSKSLNVFFISKLLRKIKEQLMRRQMS